MSLKTITEIRHRLRSLQTQIKALDTLDDIAACHRHLLRAQEELSNLVRDVDTVQRQEYVP